MITVGEVLRKAREKKKMNISEIQSITRIVSRYIEALENNSFDQLPGDIYVKGFLKNISEVLDLNPQEVIELYRLQKAGIVGTAQSVGAKNKTKQNPLFKSKKEVDKEGEEKEDIILEESIENDDDSDSIEEEDSVEDVAETIEEDKKVEEDEIAQISKVEKKPAITPRQVQKYSSQNAIQQQKKKIEQYDLYSAESALLMLSREDISQNNSRRSRNKVLIISGVAIFVLIMITLLFKNNISYLLFRGKNENINTSVQRNIVDTVANQNVKVGDIVYFKPLGISATIKFVSIGNVVRVNINGSDLSLSKSNPILVDLNSNGVNDFRMTLIEVYEDLATVRMERLEENQMVNSNVDMITDSTQSTNITDSNNVYAETQTPLGSSDINIVNGEIYIESDVEKKEIKIDITAKRFVYVRYFIDSERPATVNLLSGRSLNLEARDVIMLTIGNVAEVVVRINGKVVSLGEFGETVNKTIKWVKNVNDSTKFNLVVSDTK